MNKFFITLSFCLVTFSFFSKSKKEIINLLNRHIDSSNQIINIERSDIEQLIYRLVKFRVQIIELNDNFQNIELNNNGLINNVSEKEVIYTKTINQKQDSLALIAVELLKYRPIPVKEEPKLILKEDKIEPIKSVTIGTQVWMLENLNVSKFSNGKVIPEASTEEEWKKSQEYKQPAWCYYNNNSDNGQKYGKLYNWYAVINMNGLCPQGWHVPTDKEWGILIDYLGGPDFAGVKMKSKSGWNEKRNGDNTSGFTGLPGGYRNVFGGFGSIGDWGCWFSSTDKNNFTNLSQTLGYKSFYSQVSIKGEGFSVRCLKDS
jgi:uncharacterized protein (TIGR02145 family)